MKLDRLEYAHLAEDLSDGETGKFNHDACGDTRGRLYVTRDGRYVLAYCHNCSSGGRAVLGSRWVRAGARVVTTVPTRPEVLALPIGATDDVATQASWDALAWLRAYDLDLSSTSPYLWWDRGSESLIMAAWSADGLEGYQQRSFSRAWSGPKYLTRRRRDAKLPQPVGNCTDLAVIVEDTISALKVMQAGATGIPMWRAPGDVAGLVDVARNYGRVVVWFDNDNAEVRRNALDMARRLRAYTPDVGIIRDLSDPKHHDVKKVLAI